MNNNDMKDIHKEEDTEFWLKYWIHLSLDNINKKRNAVKEVFKYDKELKAVYWLLFAGFTSNKITQLLKEDISIIKVLINKLDLIGAERGIKFADSMDTYTHNENDFLNVIDKEADSTEQIRQAMQLDDLTRIGQKRINKDFKLNAIWWLLYGNLSIEEISILIKEDIHFIKEQVDFLDKHFLYRTRDTMDVFEQDRVWQNDFLKKYLSKKKKPTFPKHISFDY